MSIPAKLERPALDALPFINYIFHNLRQFNNKQVVPYFFTRDSWDFEDDRFNEMLFSYAEFVRPEQLAALSALTDDTFEKLIGRLNVSVNGADIHTRSDLITAASLSKKDHPMATPEQIQSFLLHERRDLFQVHFGLVADLYNDSTPDQKIAINDFFDNFLNRQLLEIIQAKGPGPLPSTMTPDMETMQGEFDSLVRCRTLGDWVREDVLASRFALEGRSMQNSGSYHLLAFASSLEEILGYATLYAKNLRPDSPLYSIQISLNDTVIASTRLISYRANTSLPEDHILPVRLDWSDSSHSKISNEAFTETAIRVEKGLGVRWSLVKKLESDLGM